jgi:hypothetical protein
MSAEWFAKDIKQRISLLEHRLCALLVEGCEPDIPVIYRRLIYQLRKRLEEVEGKG